MARKDNADQLSIDNWQQRRDDEANRYAGKTFYVVDGSSYIYRAFFAIRNLSNSRGFPTNAVYGFLQMLKKLIEGENPDYLAMTFDAFDADIRNFRHDLYAEYKATRSEMPEDLRVQLPWFRKLTRALNIPILELPAVEADDVIATLTLEARAKGFDVCIVSADKDLMQLLDDHVIMYDSMREKKYTPADVVERFGVEPARVKYVLALAGDTSDNVPGVPGIGEKTGGQLISQFGDLETLLANVDKVSGKKRQENLTNFADQARLSLELVRLREDCDIEFDPDRFELEAPDLDELTAVLSELEFDSALRDLRTWMERRGWLDDAQPSKTGAGAGAAAGAGAKAGVAEPRRVEAAEGKDYRMVCTLEELDEVIIACHAAERFGFDLETTSVDPLEAEIVGMSFSWADDQAVYIPVAHVYDGAPAQLERDVVLERIRPLLESERAQKVGQHTKYEWLVLQKYGIEFRGIVFDTLLMSYLIDPGKNSHSLDTIALDYLGHRTIRYSDVAGSGKDQKRFDEVELEPATVYGAEDADITRLASVVMEPQLEELGLRKLHDELEVPLSRVLGIMEATGVRIDTDILGELSALFETELAELKAQIDEMAGCDLNPNSPVQLREVLFEQLRLPVKKRTRTGASTDSSVLEQLSELHPLPQLILDYRSFSKLKGTYVDALPELINPHTGRIHTDFNQAVAATGRLSSSNPNLQNIPIRTDAGRAIRRAFVAEPGYRLIAADYSQIELRIMAHMSGDPVLLDAYRKGLDIHATTAAQIFEVPIEDVTAAQRRAGKTINFGVMYGMGARRLARDLKISMGEAKSYIDAYFERYAGVASFFERLVETTRESGYAETMFGRKRHLPGINGTGGQRAFSERAAINTPIQGTAADIIKYAMVNAQAHIEAHDLPARMLLQVHDELIFEVREDAVDAARDAIVSVMEGVCELDAPLVVDVGIGDNWLDAK